MIDTRRCREKDVHRCADITDSDYILRDPFIAGLKADPVQRALQENVKAQPTTSFHNGVVDVVAWDQEETDATVAVTKKFEVVSPRKDSSQPYRGDNPLHRDPEEDQRYWQCGHCQHISKNCGRSTIRNPSRPSFNY